MVKRSSRVSFEGRRIMTKADYAVGLLEGTNFSQHNLGEELSSGLADSSKTDSRTVGWFARACCVVEPTYLVVNL